MSEDSRAVRAALGAHLPAFVRAALLTATLILLTSAGQVLAAAPTKNTTSGTAALAPTWKLDL